MLIEVVRAYMRRKREFVRIAQALGAQTIAGLQPWSESKADLSRTETARIAASWSAAPNHQHEFARGKGCLCDAGRRETRIRWRTST